MARGRVGIYIDLLDERTDGTRSFWQEVRKMAQEAERIGCDSVWLADRLQLGDAGVWESTTMVAAVTEKVMIGTAVTGAQADASSSALPVLASVKRSS